MSDPDGSHSCRHNPHESGQADPEDPGPRHLRLATNDVNGRLSIRA